MRGYIGGKIFFTKSKNVKIKIYLLAVSLYCRGFQMERAMKHENISTLQIIISTNNMRENAKHTCKSREKHYLHNI